MNGIRQIANAVRRRYFPHPDAEDLLQEAVVYLLAHDASYDATRTPTWWAWARKQAEQAMRMYLRRTRHTRAKTKIVSISEYYHPHPASRMTGPGLPPEIVAREQRSRIENALPHLVPAQRRVIELVLDPDAKCRRHIGEKLKLKPASVTSIRSQAIRRLRNLAA